MAKRSEQELIEMLCDFLKRIHREAEKGRTLVFVDEKLVDWVKEQGKYRSESEAIESLIRKEMKGTHEKS